MAVNQWFRHDVNLCRQPEVIRMMMKYSWQGYGIYMGLLEHLYQEGTNNKKMCRLDVDVLAYMLRADAEIISNIISNFNLFVVDGEYFYSELITQNAGEREQSTKARAEAGKNGAKKRWSRQTDSTETQLDNSNVIANEKQTDIKPIANDSKAIANDSKPIAMQWQTDSKPIANDSTIQYNTIQDNRLSNDNLVGKNSDNSESCEKLSLENSEEENELAKKDVSVKTAIETYNRLCPSLPKAISCTANRRRKILSRLAEMDGLGKFAEICQLVNSSAFLRGDSGQWRASLDWLIENSDNWRRVAEGNYSDKKPTQPNQKNQKSNSLSVNAIW